MRLSLLLGILLVLPAPVAAQDEAPLRRAVAQAFQQRQPTDAALVAAEAARQRAERDRLNTASWVYVATAGADWAVTAVCAEVRCGRRTQAGPFLRGVEPHAAIPIGLAIDAAILVGVRELVAPEYPRFAQVLLYGLSGVRVALTIDHVRDLRRNAVRRPGR